METVMAVSPERTAELVALLEKALGLTPRPKPKPKAVVDDGEVVRDADVRVSPTDPNYRGSDEGVVRVRRSDFVTINMEAWEAQQRAKAEDRRLRRALDPYRLGHWGPIDD
jgi:hypothetical protein